MNRQIEAIIERLAELSDAMRLRLLRVVEAEELSVGEVSAVLQLPQSTVSRHLKVLADGGWVARRAAGTASLFRLVMDDLSPERRALWVIVRGRMDESVVEVDVRRLRDVVAQRRLDSQAFFGRVSGEWDAVRAELFGASVTAAALMGLLDPSWVVADLGCGTGNAAELLAGHVKRVVCVDQSPEMLAAARRRLAGVGNVEFVQGELSRLTMADASVDAAVMMLVLHHVEEPGAAIAEAARVLRPGGRLLVVDMGEHQREEYKRTMGHRHLGFSERSLESMFEAAGLSEVRVVRLAGVSEAKGPGLVGASGRRVCTTEGTEGTEGWQGEGLGTGD